MGSPNNGKLSVTSIICEPITTDLKTIAGSYSGFLVFKIASEPIGAAREMDAVGPPPDFTTYCKLFSKLYLLGGPNWVGRDLSEKGVVTSRVHLGSGGDGRGGGHWWE